MLEPDNGEQRKKRLAESLRELRRAAGLSGERLAARAAMSQSKVSRIESGRLLPSVVDVERIVAALGVPQELSGELLSAARVANADYSSLRSSARTGLWRRQAEFKALIESASTVRQFLPAIPTGLIQTPDYARAVLTPTVEGRPARNIDRMVLARLKGQDTLNDESRQFFFLLTEQAVRWRRAEPAIMQGQLRHMSDIARRPNVELAIIPQTADVYASPLNIFFIYDERLVRVELFSGEVALRDPRDISYHLNLFEYFRGHAVAGERAIELLNSVAEEFMRERD